MYGSCPICGRKKGYDATDHRCSRKTLSRIDREERKASDSEFDGEPDAEPDEVDRLIEGLAILERVGD